MPNDLPRVYFDANVFIYALERDDDRGRLARRWIIRAERREIELVTSELTLAEVLSQPFERGDEELADAYQRVLTARSCMQVAPVDRSTLLSAARLRAALKLDLPDALHVATAVQTECDSFLTEDARLRVPPPLRKLSLKDVTDAS